jgi:hypothetical protein
MKAGEIFQYIIKTWRKHERKVWEILIKIKRLMEWPWTRQFSQALEDIRDSCDQRGGETIQSLDFYSLCHICFYTILKACICTLYGQLSLYYHSTMLCITFLFPKFRFVVFKTQEVWNTKPKLWQMTADNSTLKKTKLRGLSADRGCHVVRVTDPYGLISVF